MLDEAQPSKFDCPSRIARQLNPTYHIDVWCGHWYIQAMGANRKITLELSEDLLRRAQESTGEGVTATVRRGLELLAASKAYTELQKLRGKVKVSIKLKQLRNDQ